MTLRGRYSPFNLAALNARLRHDLLILAGATNPDHDARYVLQGDHIELIVDGNVAGDNGNWQAIIVGNNIEVQKRIGGLWVFAFGITPPP